MPGDVPHRLGVAHDDRAGADRLEPRLVEVDRDRVGALDARQQVAPTRGREQPASVRGVHMEPCVVSRAHVGDAVDRVDRTEVGGARGGHDGHRQQVVRGGTGERVGEREGVHAVQVVGGHQHDRLGAETHDARGLLHAEVALGRREDAQARQRGGQRRRGVALGEARLAPGQQQRLQVRLRATAREDAVGLRAEADAAGGPVDQLALDQGAARALVPRVERGVDGRDEHLGEQRRHDHGAVEVGGVAGVVEPDGVVEVDLAQLREHPLEVERGAVEVDGVDLGRGVGGGDARERALESRQVAREVVDTAVQRRGVLVDRVDREQVVRGGHAWSFRVSWEALPNLDPVDPASASEMDHTVDRSRPVRRLDR